MGSLEVRHRIHAVSWTQRSTAQLPSHASFEPAVPGWILPICTEGQQFAIHSFKAGRDNPMSPLPPGSYLERADKWAGWNWYWAVTGAMIPLLHELHLQGGTHQQHLWWLQTWQVWHIRLLIPHTKHSHALLIICGEILISTCPSVLLFPSQPPCCLHTAVLTAPARCAFQYLQHWVLPQVHCAANPKSLSWLLCKAWKSLHTEICCQGQLPLPALPEEQEKGQAFPLSWAAQFQMGFGDQLGVCAKAHPAAQLGQLAAAHHWHSWDSHGAWLTAQTLEKSSSQLVQNTPALLSHTRKRLVLARPEKGILSILPPPFA